MENKPFISGAATSGDLKATTMRKSSSSLNRLREKCKDYLVSVLTSRENKNSESYVGNPGY